jgi:DNA-binding transcriptional LysR family regulator
MPPEFDLIDVYLVINTAECGSISRGAANSGLSVPSASVRIKRLEDTFGVKLFERVGRGTKLTTAGSMFLLHARGILDHAENLKIELREHARMKTCVRLFANRYAATELMPRVLSKYTASHADVLVDFRQHISTVIVREVSEGLADIGVIATSDPVEGLEVFPYGCVRYVLVVPKNHPLAELQTVSFEQSLAYPQVTVRDRPDERNAKARIEVDDFEMMCRMIECEVGVGHMLESVARRCGKTMKVSIVALTDHWAQRQLSVCVRDRKQLPLPAQELIDLILTEGKSE